MIAAGVIAGVTAALVVLVTLALFVWAAREDGREDRRLRRPRAAARRRERGRLR